MMKGALDTRQWWQVTRCCHRHGAVEDRRHAGSLRATFRKAGGKHVKGRCNRHRYLPITKVSLYWPCEHPRL